MKCNVIWIDSDLDNEENRIFIKELSSNGSYNVGFFQNVDKAIEHMRYIYFEETKLIVSGKLYPEFVQKFKENIIDMYIAPKIIILTKNKQSFISSNIYNQNNTFYNFGGVVDTFQEVQKFLHDENKLIKLKNADKVKLTFEFIDNKEKLVLPLFFKSLIELSKKDVANFNYTIYNEYSSDEQVKNLLDSIKSFSDLPIEILCKYYAKLYTSNTKFHENLNRDLGTDKVEKYLPFIKTLYEGVKLKSLPLANNNILYRGTEISKNEIQNIMQYINQKIPGLPSSIVFSKSFLSFSKNKMVAENFMYQCNDVNSFRVLFILEKDDNIEYNLSTHADIEKISFFPGEKEVLFFPFSSFEIKEIKPVNIGYGVIYEIKLLYLGKYLKDIEKEKSIIINKNKIPDTEFKKQLIEVGLIQEQRVEQINKIILYNNYKQYESNINRIQRRENYFNNCSNCIVGEIYINKREINKYNRIINSFEDFKRGMTIKNSTGDDWKFENEKEIIDNIEIRINEKVIPFSYDHKFEKEGKHKIQYTFKNYLTKTNHLFWNCNLLTNLNLSNFYSQNVTNMCYMFGGCNSLKNLNLSNFNTQKVTNMSSMFLCCYSLKNLDLTNFNTQNVINMSNIFTGCNSLNIISRDYKILNEFNNKK